MVTVIGSLKGGSGKSTVTFNLAVWLSLAEAEVQVWDLDPQATLSDVAEVRREEDYAPHIAVRQSHDFDGGGDPSVETLVDVGTANMEGLHQALSRADRVLVPVPPSQADVWSTQRFLSMIDAVENDRGRPEVLAFINRADTHPAVRETSEAAAALVTLKGLRFLRRRLCQRTTYRRSFSEGLAVFELEPRGKATRELLGLAADLFPQSLGAA